MFFLFTFDANPLSLKNNVTGAVIEVVTPESDTYSPVLQTTEFPDADVTMHRDPAINTLMVVKSVTELKYQFINLIYLISIDRLTEILFLQW
jgi:hypothetical protein